MTTERQMKILQYLIRNDRIEVTALSQLLQVSPSTVRRELREMEQHSLLIRDHGAVHLPAPIRYKLTYENRAAQQIGAKRKIAATAKRFVNSNQIIGLSGGTTCTELARQLRAATNVTIVTNAVNVALELQGLGKRVVVTGGVLNQNSYEMVGNLTTQTLQNIHLDTVFLGVNGVDVEFGFSIFDEPEAATSRAFIEASDQAIVLADHTKIEETTFVRLCSLHEVDLLITDDGISLEQLTALTQANLKVLIAE